MKKILIIGNSHVGALKQASERQNVVKKIEEGNIEITFCATTGAVGLTVADKSVFVEREHSEFNAFKMTSRADSINLMHYDRIFLLGRTTPLNARLYFGINDFPHALSNGIVAEICRMRIGVTFNGKGDNAFYKGMVTFTERPVYWVPNPCEPEALNTCFKEGSVRHPAFQNIANMPGCMRVFEEDLYAHQELLYELSHKVRKISLEIVHSMGLESIIFPPTQLLLPDGFRTQDRYSRGSRHFLTNHAEPHVDPHMNADYGEHMLDSIMEKI